jgi:hypothetical protein
MKKLTILLIVLLALSSCKGHGRGPLARDSFSNKEMNKDIKNQKGNSPVAIEKINVAIKPCKDCITISNLLGNKKSYSGKVVRVKGKVTKYNPQIMGKNWIHIQDGSEFQGGFDLTITTDIQVSVGDTVTFEGNIALDKDFGYGYYYNVLMEEGKVAPN